MGVIGNTTPIVPTTVSLAPLLVAVACASSTFIRAKTDPQSSQ